MSDYKIIVKKPPDYKIIVSQQQGPQGDVTPEAQAAKEAAEKAAENAKESEKNAKESELSAADSARSLLPYKAEPWDEKKIYNYPDAVIYNDGYFYRCIGENISGEPPNISNDWVRFMDCDDFWEVDDEGYLTPTRDGRRGNKWILDENGDIMPHPDLNINPPRNLVPRNDKETGLGAENKKWGRVYGYEGYFDNFSNVENTKDANKPVSAPQKSYIDAQDAATLASAKSYTDAHNTNVSAHADIRNILKNAVGIPTWDGTNHVLKFTANDGSVLTIDLPIEGLAKDLDYDQTTKKFILTRQDGTKREISAADLVDVYIGYNGTHIQTTVEPGNIIKAILKAGTITETELSAALLNKINEKELEITPGTTNQYFRGDKTWRDLAADVKAVVLSGLSTATNAAITAADNILAALGKLQAQISAHKGAKGIAEHGLGDGVNAGFSTNDYSNTEKNKLDALTAALEIDEDGYLVIKG